MSTIKEYSSLLRDDGTPYLVEVREHENPYGAAFCVSNADDVWRFMDEVLSLGKRQDEYVYCLGADSKLRPLGVFEASHGSWQNSIVDVKSIASKLLMLGASAALLAHNHPSGDPTPSREDHESTILLKNGLDLVGIRLLDHIVLGRGRFISFQERGML